MDQGMQTFDVVCLGIMIADVLARPVSRLPERGKLDLVDRMELHTGGCAVNTGIALTRLGIRTAVMGKVGEDGFGDYVINTLQRNGIDTSGVMRDHVANTSATMVMIGPDGERSFIHYLGANAELRQADVNMDIVKRGRILHIAGHNLMPKFDGADAAAVLQAARELSVQTSLDTAWDATGRWLRLIEPCLPHVDYFVPSFEEARMIAGREEPADVAHFFLDYGIKIVALKMGEAGCYVTDGRQAVRLPAYPVQPVDTTGAGDSFAAGFLAGIIQGWDLEQTARFANAVGAMCVTSIGATSGVRSLQETLAFMKHMEQ
ncbi:MAG: sugar kinase [Anaerolineae bacterium]|nr:sugar kinase [Anaerolineae bacterium]